MISKSLLKRAKKIKLLAMDVDGVLTGGEIIILNSGEELKIWSVRDRMGFSMLRQSGLDIRMAWVTARGSEQVKKRAEDLRIHYLFQKTADKWKIIESCAKELNLSPEEIAYVGDDYIDLPALKRVGLAVCPPEAPPELKKVCHHTTQAQGGRGVIREVIEIILKGQDRWKTVLKHYAMLFIACAWIFTGCSKSVPPQDFSEKPDQWIEHFTITETQAGLPVWILNSEIAQVFEKKKIVTLDAIRIQFMNRDASGKKYTQASLLVAKKNQVPIARLVAPKGEVNTENHDLKAWDGVEVESDDGTKLYTERLSYSTEKKKILSDAPVKIVRQDSILLGEGLEATPDLSVVKIFKHQASVYPKKLQTALKDVSPTPAP